MACSVSVTQQLLQCSRNSGRVTLTYKIEGCYIEEEKTQRNGRLEKKLGITKIINDQSQNCPQNKDCANVKIAQEVNLVQKSKLHKSQNYPKVKMTWLCPSSREAPTVSRISTRRRGGEGEQYILLKARVDIFSDTLPKLAPL